MTDPTHPLARLKEAAIHWVRQAPMGYVAEVFRLSMRVSLITEAISRVDDIRLSPETAIEDLRYEIAEWSTPDVSRGQPVEVLGRASSMDGAKALLEAEYRRAPGKTLVVRQGALVKAKAGPGTEPDGGR
jgi:hypothetical protein